MTKQSEALRLALEALVKIPTLTHGVLVKLSDLEAALHKAVVTKDVSLPEQEPFSHFKAEPFSWVDCEETDEGAIPLYEKPFFRSHPLTDEEINALELPPSGTGTVRDMVRLIEAAHGIKEAK